MHESKKNSWRKLDTIGKLFPATSSKNDTRVFRFYCELKETIQKELLQKALDKTVEEYPVFLSVMRKGVFWHYLEKSRLKPVVEEEFKEPCSNIYIRDKRSLLFEVTYYENRINLEIYHALTDGTGATWFLRDLVKNYLLLSHKEEGLPDLPLKEDMMTVKDQEMDGFTKYYSKEIKKPRTKKIKAHQIRKKGADRYNLKLMEATVSVKEVLAKSRELKVSMTEFLTAVYFCAIHQEMTKEQEKNPVVFMIPVNLRKFFPSRSMLNFFGWIEPKYKFGEGKDCFEDILEYVTTFFKEELTQRKMAEHMNEYIALEKNPFLRIAPLELKNVCMNAGAKLADNELTAIFSNMSVVKMPEEYVPYIERFGVYTSTRKMELCACSFGDKLSLGFTGRCDCENIMRNFFQILSKMGISYTIEHPPYPEERTNRGTVKKAFQWFTFLCIAVTVVFAGINGYLFPKKNWYLIVAGAMFSLWLFMTVGFKKRHNLLKDAIWEMSFVGTGCIIWDICMGWRAWSVNYACPIFAVIILCTMLMIIKVQNLVAKEYMIYLLMASTSGIILPSVLILFQIVTITLPSIICVIVYILCLAALLIFKKRELVHELDKKFHV